MVYKTNILIPTHQFSFRKGREAVESFLSLITDIAFDNVKPGILIRIINYLEIAGKLCYWIFKYKAGCRVEGKNIKHRISK